MADPTLPTFEIGDQVYERGRWSFSDPSTVVAHHVTHTSWGTVEETYDVQHLSPWGPRMVGGDPWAWDSDYQDSVTRRVRAEDLSKVAWPSPWSGMRGVVTGIVAASGIIPMDWHRAPMWGEPAFLPGVGTVTTSKVVDTPVVPVTVPRLTYSPSEPDPL